MSYCSKKDGSQSYDLAIAALREIGIRRGNIQPSNEIEKRWQKEGVRPNDKLESLPQGR